MLDTGSSLSWIQTTDCQTTPQLCNQAPKFNTFLSSTITHEQELIAVRYTEGVIRTQLASDIVTLGTAPPPTYVPLLFTAAAGFGVNNSSVLSNSSTTTAATNVRAPSTPTTTTTTLVKSHGQKTTSTASPATPAGTNGSQETEEAAEEQQNELGSIYFSERFRGQRTFGLTTDISGDPFLLAKEVNVPGFLGASQRRFESDSDYPVHTFSEIVNELPIPVFSLAFTESWGTLTLGGPDPIFYSKPITWINTLKGEAGWVTHLSSHIDIYAKGTDSITIPDSETDYVRTNLDRVWFDSGTTYIWGDERAVTPLNDWMGAHPVTGQVNCSTIPSLGTIVFSIGGNEETPLLRLELSPAEYIIGTPTSRQCFTALNVAASSKNHWIFGLHVMKAFYTVYHYEYGLIGVAPYNITANNPGGKAIVPGIHEILDQEVKESLQKMPSSGQKSLTSPPLSMATSFLLFTFLTIIIYCIF
ncbi:hypothetical protein KI688_006872 [Linnemannia hyalina]|uniref:Peptidase A1 domain-containing protein n=1 Tax=Linnemannia hyalina TaxID=64524 RepID=A0A9P7XKB8_9FUNG|nr:hypothetical protein KI688_006872 [Linnemannia hyalina]